jgi:hypothetical protein
MLVLGLILILVSAGSLVAVLASGTDDKAVLFGNVTMPTLVVFLLGAAALLIFIMGLELVRSGVRRANENRKAKKKLRTLEKREATRSDAPTAGEPTGTGTAAASTTGEPTRHDGDPTTTQPIRTSGDEPHQTPPPPHR